MLTRSIYGSDPLREMRRLQSEVNRLFQSALPSGAVSFPPMNVYATPDGIAITAELPGVAEDELEISVHRDTVTLTGERKDPAGSEGSGENNFHRRERGRGRFSRTLSLPFQVDSESVEAHLKNGVLRLSLQRPESDKPKRIQLKRR
jgi:HSP20 family protein